MTETTPESIKAGFSRRKFLTLGATAAAIGAAAPLMTRSISTAEAAVAPVVVVGGGMGGVTLAKYLRLWSGKTIPVTLIDTNVDYTSSIMSNLVLNGQRTLTSLKFAYSTLRSTYGVNVLQGSVLSVNPTAKTVTYRNSAGGSVMVAYSRLVMAPGIDFLPIPKFTGTTVNKAKVVHAWQAGPQTQALRDQLVAMPVDGKFILAIPKSPYRCPPGPYERACLVADWIKKNKRSLGNTKAQVIVLDANHAITAEAHSFTTAFNTIHAGVVQYVPNAQIFSVNADKKTVVTAAGTFRGNILNIIPDHTAPRIVRDMGLATSTTPAGGVFCPVNVLSYESTVISGIHVIGDASATTQPKAGHIANAEAKVCADALVRLLSAPALPLDSNPVTNSSCYSPITSSTASWLAVVFHYDPASKAMKPAAGQPAEAPAITADNYKEMNTWFRVLMADTFGN